jgi:dihydrofolate reductase
MRKITVLSMITLDGVMQGPGGPEEDTSGGFEFGGWVAPFGDEVSGQVMGRLLKPADLLLGRKTFDIWEDYWPKHTSFWPTINEVTKIVYSSTKDQSNWENCVFINSVKELEEIKNSEGRDIQVWGSGQLFQLLLQNDLVDELWLMIHPITLGKGKRLFEEGPIPAAFKLTESIVTTTGVILASYVRDGEVKTGTVGAPEEKDNKVSV